MMRFFSLSVIFLAMLMACKRSIETESQTAFDVASWSAQPKSNLLFAVGRNKSINLCLEPEGLSDDSKFKTDSDYFRLQAKLALLEWFRALNIQVEIKHEIKPCHADLAAGKLLVVLHYNEELFQKEISQAKSWTLGAYFNDRLYLNIAGVKNPRRDSTKGYKTILHELGHIFGLNHSNVRGSVMFPNLLDASAHLTDDDRLGIEAAWKKVQLSIKNDASKGTNHNQNDVLETTNQQATKNNNFDTLTLRQDSFFKASTEQSADLSDKRKCLLKRGQVLLVKVLDEWRPTKMHLHVQLQQSISSCLFGSEGQIGFLYAPHVN